MLSTPSGTTASRRTPEPHSPTTANRHTHSHGTTLPVRRAQSSVRLPPSPTASTTTGHPNSAAMPQLSPFAEGPAHSRVTPSDPLTSTRSVSPARMDVRMRPPLIWPVPLPLVVLHPYRRYRSHFSGSSGCIARARPHGLYSRYTRSIGSQDSRGVDSRGLKNWPQKRLSELLA